MWGGNPAGLVNAAGLRSRPGASKGLFLVQTEESYQRRPRPGLITVRRLAGLGQQDRLDYLATRDGEVEPQWLGLAAAVEVRRTRAERTSELLAGLNHMRLATYGVSVKDLPEQSRNFLEMIVGIELSEDPDVHPFKDGTVHLTEVSPALHHRMKLASVWLRIEHDPRLASGDLSDLGGKTEAEDAIFASAQGLYTGVYLLDAYLGPLLSCLSPFVWAIHVQRGIGNLIFTLGTAMSGTSDDAVEPLQLIAIPGAERRVQRPTLRAESQSAAIRCWIEWLDRMFGVLSDLAVFTDKSGRYRPSRQLQAMLTAEQVFRRMTSLLVAHRDVNARRALAFSVFDSLEAMTGIDFDRMCTLSYAESTLRFVESQIDGEAADLLLPMARRAIDGLREMQDGFFMVRQLGLDGVPSGDGRAPMSRERAVARYLKLLRNATHGHGATKVGAVKETDLLLAHHDGDVPHDLGLLTYLYLLDLLLRPDRLRTVLHRQARRT